MQPRIPLRASFYLPSNLKLWRMLFIRCSVSQSEITAFIEGESRSKETKMYKSDI